MILTAKEIHALTKKDELTDQEVSDVKETWDALSPLVKLLEDAGLRDKATRG